MESEPQFDSIYDDECTNMESGYETANRSCNQTTTPFSGIIELPEPNLWCLALVLLPATCIFGNFLVVVAVLKERSLKTSTNFLLVSLACADLLVGTLVMPFSVYLTINRLNWFLPDAVCNFFCVADVSASTASIVHLVAISIDRFYAVVRHMEYKSPKHKRRVYCTILFSWLFSIGIGLPLGIGMNQSDASSKEPYQCGIVNPDYMLYMSVFAFYIPCSVMSVMYGFVFYRLHKRMRAVELQEMAAGQMVQFGDHLGNIFQNVYGNPTRLRQASIMWAMPFLKTIEATIAENDDVSTEELDELTTILHTLESDPHRQAMENVRNRYENGSQGLFRNTGRRLSALLASARRRLSSEASKVKTSSGSTGLDGETTEAPGFVPTGPRRRRQSLYVAKQKIKTLKDRAITLLMRLRSRQGMAIRKETRATKLVATVMLLFLLCYMPFFTLNIVKVYMLRRNTWNYDLEGLFIFFTWLGYVNSCLNPLIYSLFNRKFRASFQKLLHCAGDHSETSGRQKRLSRVAIDDSDERNSPDRTRLVQFRSWVATHKGSNLTSPVRRSSQPPRQQKDLVTRTPPPPSRNGIAVNASRTRLPPTNKLSVPLLAVQCPSTIIDNDALSRSQQPLLKLSKSVSLASTRTFVSSSLRSRSNTGSLRSQMLPIDVKGANESDYDADEELSLKRQQSSPLMEADCELAMLRRAQFSGYTQLYDQIRDFNEPVEV